MSCQQFGVVGESHATPEISFIVGPHTPASPEPSYEIRLCGEFTSFFEFSYQSLRSFFVLIPVPRSNEMFHIVITDGLQSALIFVRVPHPGVKRSARVACEAGGPA